MTTAAATTAGPAGTDVVAVPLVDAGAARRLKWIASCAGVLLGAVPFLSTLWDYGLHPLRNALPTRFFSNFFDIQAEAFLRGDLAVPTGSLSIEGFRHRGHEYMYFGPLPAILRLPVVAITHSLDGRLTAPSMLLGWLVAAIFVALIVWRIRAMVTPGRHLGAGEAVVVAGFIAVVLGGSPVALLAATPWVYSEALMWAFATTVGALYALLGVLQRPTWGRILATGLLTVGAVLSRPTAGWGCGLAVVGAGVLFAASPARRAARSFAPWIVAAGAIPLLLGMALNVAKFGQPLSIPFDEQVWTSRSMARRAVLADGGVVGLRFLPTTVLTYLRPDGVRLSSVFPFLSPPAEPPHGLGGVRLDMSYRTPSVPAFMPLLAVAAVVGAVAIFRPRAAVGRASLRIPVLGALSITAGVLSVGYVAPRYLVEFLPVLLVAGAAGLFVVVDRIGGWSRRGRTLLGIAALALALFGAAANLATAVTTARVTAGGSALRGLVETQQWVSDRTGRPVDVRVADAGAVPSESEPDELLIWNHCRALLLGTGDHYDPWVPIDLAPVDMRVRLTGPSSPGPVDLVRFDGSDGAAVRIEFDDRGSYRIVTTGTQGGYTSSVWKPAVAGTVIDIAVRPSTGNERYLIDIPEHVYTETPLLRHLPDPRGQLVLARPIPSAGGGTGLGVAVRSPSVSSLCAGLLDDV